MPVLVPETSDLTPIIGFPEFRTHLEKLRDDPSAALNAKIIEDVSFQLTPNNIPSLLPIILPIATDIIKTTAQDSTPLLELTIKLLSPLSFNHLLATADPPTILSALRSPLPSANRLGLSIIHKAASSPSDVGVLSQLPEVVLGLFKIWLETPDTGVANAAEAAIGDILYTDCRAGQRPQINGFRSQVQNQAGTPGEGQLWSSVFESSDYLSLIKERCQLLPDSDHRQVTTSQGRLLAMLPRLATINLQSLIRAAPDGIDFPVRSPQLSNGILQWASLEMVDTNDILMRLTLVDFYLHFVEVMHFTDKSKEDAEFVKTVVQTWCQEHPGLEEDIHQRQQMFLDGVSL